MANQQKMRLIDCFYQPNSVFSLYDYTKIIYPIDGYICMRQITSPDSQPAFIKLEHDYDKIHSLLTYPNLIVSLEENAYKEFIVGFYESVHFHTKLVSCLAEQFRKVLNSSVNENSLSKKLEFKVKNSSDNIFVLFSLKHQTATLHQKQHAKATNKSTISLANQSIQEANDNELIVVNVKTKRIVSRNFFSGNVKQLFVKSNDSFTLLYEDSNMTEYQLYENLAAKEISQSYYMMKKRQVDFIHPSPKSKHEITSHLWLKEQLIVVNSTAQQICVYVENKKAQQISLQMIKNIKLLRPLMSGFLLCNQNFMYVYKKAQLSYVCIAQFFIRQIGFSPQLILSPQQDILAYFMDSSKSIQYINCFSDEVEAQMGSQKIQTKELKQSGSIEFKKDHGLRIDVNRKNNTFVMSHQSAVQLYSINNFEIYLEESIQSEQVSANSPVGKGRLKRMNTLGSVQGLIQQMGKQQVILRVAIHPYCELLAIALKSKVRIYQILFNQLSHVKDVFVANCNEMFYSNSGQFLSIVVSGKNGSKCYVYKTNEDYEIMECLSIGKKIQKYVWSKYDNFLYGVYSNGYYRWGIDNGLKNRFETLFDLPFSVTDAILDDQKDAVVLYGENHILQINQKMDQQNEFNSKDIIKVKRRIKQMVYQNGSYFLNILAETTTNTSSTIIKCQDLSTLDVSIKQCFEPTPQHLSHTKPPTFYRDSTGQIHDYQMLVCSGEAKRNIIFLIDEEARNIKVLEWGKTANNEAKITKNSDLIKIDRKHLRKLFKKYTKYEDEIKALEENLHQTIEQLKSNLAIKQRQRQQSFLRQMQANEQKYEQVKQEKQKLEHTIEQKIEKHENKTIKQIKQLQKIYERKIAITTNKLLTSQEINYRNMLLAQENLKKLERESNHDVEKIREEYKKQLAEYMNEKDNLAEEILKVKKEYESRLYDLEQENEKILEQYQSKSQDTIHVLRRNLVNEEIKYSEALSKKDNLQKALQQLMVSSQILKEKITYLESKNRQANKKSEYLMFDIQKYEKILEEKSTSIAIYEERINDLEKSNEILKYRVIQLKGQTEPQSQENEKLKDNLNELQAQYDKIVKSAFEKQQTLSIVKKESQKNKEIVQKLQSKIKRIEKTYLEFLDKVLNITKSPIQQIRKQLINLLNTTKQDEKYLNRPTSSYARSQSPLGQLNRIREHLESCLHEAVDSNKKNQQQKKVELLKKNRENSELIKEINDLRRKVRDMEGVIKDKDLQINRLLRGDPIMVNDLRNVQQKENRFVLHPNPYTDDQNKTQQLSMNYQSSNQKNQASRSQTRKQTRQTKESFFDKSLFKSSTHWREKRLKTEHSQHRPHVQSRSVKRNTSGKFLQIDNGSGFEDVEDLKRIIDQKETIIKQLINKIQSLS